MKLLSKVGSVSLALAMSASFALAAVPRMAAAAPEENVCAEASAYCDQWASNCEGPYGICYEVCFVIIYDEAGIDCNACGHAQNLCSALAEFENLDPAECMAGVQSEFGLSCRLPTTAVMTG